MKYGKTLVVHRVCDLYALADREGDVCVASRPWLLYDIVHYACIHDVTSWETLKERFSAVAVFCR